MMDEPFEATHWFSQICPEMKVESKMKGYFVTYEILWNVHNFFSLFLPNNQFYINVYFECKNVNM